ncbi:MAG: hypothetical protein VZR00_02095 [Lachnospiraceae bacterium]|nr:hypothetical protein [Lachnospiraceae bacterium]MEE3460666.1 hypothetical protein [Lachnospiraceae bacterium]
MRFYKCFKKGMAVIISAAMLIGGSYTLPGAAVSEAKVLASVDDELVGVTVVTREVGSTLALNASAASAESVTWYESATTPAALTWQQVKPVSDLKADPVTEPAANSAAGSAAKSVNGTAAEPVAGPAAKSVTGSAVKPVTFDAVKTEMTEGTLLSRLELKLGAENDGKYYFAEFKMKDGSYEQTPYYYMDLYTYVKYDLNGGLAAGGSFADQKYFLGETFMPVKNAPERFSYKFLGWSVNKAAASADSAFNITGPVTLYAIWQDTISPATVTAVTASSLTYNYKGYEYRPAIKLKFTVAGTPSAIVIFRKKGDASGSGAYKKLKTIKPDVRAFTDKNKVKRGKTYTYYIRLKYLDAGGNEQINDSAPFTYTSKTVLKKPKIKMSKSRNTLIMQFKKAEGSGYQIQYMYISENKWKDVPGIGKGLKEKQTLILRGKGFKLRVRTYSKVGKNVYYSDWIKTKKY